MNIKEFYLMFTLIFVMCVVTFVASTEYADRHIAAAANQIVSDPAGYRRANNDRFHPGYGACGRCGRTWDICSGHDTMYEQEPSGAGEFCFPLCEECWGELQTPERRMPYYRGLMDEWVSESKDWNKSHLGGKPWDPEKKWPEIEAAVLAGK